MEIEIPFFQIKVLHDTPMDQVVLDFNRAIELRPDFVHYKIQLLDSQCKCATEQQNAAVMTELMSHIRELVRRNPSSFDANMFIVKVTQH